MRLFHLTHHPDRVIALGFIDGEEQPGEDGALHRGVWMSDRPLEAKASILGHGLLVLDVPDALAGRYEHRMPPGSSFREFCIPAAELRGITPRLVADRVLPTPLRDVLGRLPQGAGPLGLLSSDEWTSATAGFDRLLLAMSRGARVAIIVAAAPETATERGAQAAEHFRGLGAEPIVVPVVERAHADDRHALPDVDLVSIGGGDPGVLRATLADTPVWREILERWERGMGLSGSSAGAMLLCSHLLLPEPGASEPTIWSEGPGPLSSVGLAVHASSRPRTWLAEIARTAPVPLIAIDDQTGIVCTAGGDPRIIGPGDAWHVHAATLAAAEHAAD